MQDLILIGGGGHAKVVADIALQCGYRIKGFLEDDDTITSLLGYPNLGPVSSCKQHPNVCFVIAIGDAAVRERIYSTYSLRYITLIHPSAQISPHTTIKEGTVVMPGAVINACAKIGRCCIVNSGTVVEHDCCVGDFVHLAPHSTLCGGVNVGNSVWVGAGSTVIQCLKICDYAYIGAGAVVVRDIETTDTYIGVPAIKKDRN